MCPDGHKWHICQAHWVAVLTVGLHGFDGCSCPATPEIKKLYDEYWKTKVEVHGLLDRGAVMRELFDYHNMLMEVPKVYCHVTGNRISKPNTHATAVISEHDDRQRDDLDTAIAEAIEPFREAIIARHAMEPQHSREDHECDECTLLAETKPPTKGDSA